MKPYWTLNGSSLYQGHVLDVLKGLNEGSVQCIVTSPPYYGLRSYGLPPIEWPAVRYAPMAGLAEIEVPGCAEGCEHVWVTEVRTGQTGGDGTTSNLRAKRQENGTFHPDNKSEVQSKTVETQYCQLCSGWRGSLGLEPTVEMFVGHIVLVARELWRVLREDGTFWLNFGDSYASSGARSNNNGSGGSTLNCLKPGYIPPYHRQDVGSKSKTELSPGLKPKDLIGIPWRVALALQADGWYLRSDIVWAKGVSFCPTYSGSCMPESVRDRPTKGHEYVFLLSKNKRYYYDGDAVREGNGVYTRKAGGYGEDHIRPGRNVTRNEGGIADRDTTTMGRNLRTVWLINPGSYAGAHFATFPSALVEPMIRAGTSERGACPNCGAAWERVTEHKTSTNGRVGGDANWHKIHQSNHRAGGWYDAENTTTGWQPTCSCCEPEPNGIDTIPFEPIPCIVLDPFLGSGTTADVARQLGRRWIGIELSQDYCDEHIIPRLEEPLMEWAEQESEIGEPEPVQLGLL